MIKKKTPTPSARRWQAQPDDAIRLAALRWFALEIEALSIEVYASDKTKYEHLESLLRAALRKIKDTRKTLNLLDDDDCPNGFVLCKDGLCAPLCDHIAGPVDE